MPPKHLFEFTVALDQSFEPFGEASAFRIEVLLQACRQLLSNLALITLKRCFQGLEQMLALVLQTINVDTSPGLAKRDDSDLQRVEGKLMSRARINEGG